MQYTFDDEKEIIIIKHEQGNTVGIKSDDEGQCNDNGGIDELSQWMIEFDGGDKYQIINLKNVKTNKYLRLIDDGNNIDVLGDSDDKNNSFKVIVEEKENKNCIKLESISYSGKFIAVEPDKGVIISDIDNKYNKLSVWKQLNIKIGIKFKMADICYQVETVGDQIKCKQITDNKEFPDTIYLEKNQLRFVQIIKDENISIPDKTKKERPTSARDKIKMFEQKEEEKDAIKSKDDKPAPKKLKKNALAKFGNLNINPAALKPGGSPKAKILSSDKEGGNLDQKPKVEQATITKGKRKKRKKKKLLL